MADNAKKSSLDVLIPKQDQQMSGFREIEISSIKANEGQPRKKFNQGELNSLAASISSVGVLQPISVRPMGSGSFEIVSGERRWRAAQQAGLKTIPALIKQLDDENSLEHALIENIHRAELNALEEAAAYKQLIDEFNLTQEQVANKIGKSRAVVTNLLRLLTLPDDIQKALVSGEISAGHARSVASLESAPEQRKVVQNIIEKGWTVRQVEDYVQNKSAKGKTKNKKKEAAQKDPSLVELQDFLGEKLSTRVSVSKSSNKSAGKVVIEFADLEDLERIISTLAFSQQ